MSLWGVGGSSQLNWSSSLPAVTSCSKSSEGAVKAKVLPAACHLWQPAQLCRLCRYRMQSNRLLQGRSGSPTHNMNTEQGSVVRVHRTETDKGCCTHHRMVTGSSTCHTPLNQADQHSLMNIQIASRWVVGRGLRSARAAMTEPMPCCQGMSAKPAHGTRGPGRGHASCGDALSPHAC